MDRKMVDGAISALESGDSDAALKILKGMIVDAASDGGDESATPTPPSDDPAAAIGEPEGPGGDEENMGDESKATAAPPPADDKGRTSAASASRARLSIERDAARARAASDSITRDAIGIKLMRARAEGLTLKPSVEKRIMACASVADADAILDTVRESIDGMVPRARTGAEPGAGDPPGTEETPPKGRELSPATAGLLKRQGRQDMIARGRRSAPLRVVGGDAGKDGG